MKKFLFIFLLLPAFLFGGDFINPAYASLQVTPPAGQNKVIYAGNAQFTGYWGANYTQTENIMQKWIPASSHSVCQIDWWLNKQGSPTDNVRVKVYQGGTQSLNGTLIWTSNAVAGSSISGYQWVSFYNSCFTVNAGQTYWLELKRDTLDNTNKYTQNMATSATHTDGGTFSMWDTGNGGGQFGSGYNYSYANWYGYDPASIAVTNIATQSSTFTFNVSGDTSYTGAGVTCKVDLYEEKVADGSLLSSSFAQVLLDANNPQSQTTVLGNNQYGGFNFTTNNSTWGANGIEAPLFGTYSIQIVGYSRCYLNGNIVNNQTYQGLNSLNSNFTTNMIATPSALQILPPVVQPQCGTDIWCSIQQWVNSTFGFNSTFAQAQFTQLNTELLGKIPFAYIAPLSTLNLSSIGTSTSTATMTIPINITYAGHTWVNASMSSNQDYGIIGMIRGALQVIFGLSFVIYLFYLARRVF